jgi:hypothetical protein
VRRSTVTVRCAVVIPRSSPSSPRSSLSSCEAPRHPAKLLVILRSSLSSCEAPRHPAKLLVILRSSSSSCEAPRHPRVSGDPVAAWVPAFAGMTGEAAGRTGEAAGRTGEAAGRTGEAAGMTGEAAGMTGEAVGMTKGIAVRGSANSLILARALRARGGTNDSNARQVPSRRLAFRCMGGAVNSPRVLGGSVWRAFAVLLTIR